MMTKTEFCWAVVHNYCSARGIPIDQITDADCEQHTMFGRAMLYLDKIQDPAVKERVARRNHTMFSGPTRPPEAYNTKPGFKQFDFTELLELLPDEDEPGPRVGKIF